jgi:hypothetical protein
MLEWIGLLPLLGLTGNWRGYRMGGKAIGGNNMSTDMKKKFEAARAAGDMDKAKALADKVAGKAEEREKEKPVVKPIEKEATGTHDEGLKIGGMDFEQQLGKYAKDKGIELTEARDRADAVFSYTKIDYSAIRRAQQEGRYSQQAQDIENYIKDGNPYKGSVYRGLSFRTPEEKASFLKGLEGGQMKSTSMDSWSSNIKIAQEFGENAGLPQSVILGVKQNKSGVSIKGLSSLPREDEVLVGKNKSYKVVEIKQGSSGQTMVLLEED